MKRAWSDDEWRKQRWHANDCSEKTTACPDCGMPAGRNCRSHGGRRSRVHVHQARIDAWKAAGSPEPPPPPPRPLTDSLWPPRTRGRPSRERLPPLTARVIRGFNLALKLSGADIDAGKPGDFTKRQRDDWGAAARWLLAQERRRKRR